MRSLLLFTALLGQFTNSGWSSNPDEPAREAMPRIAVNRPPLESTAIPAMPASPAPAPSISLPATAAPGPPVASSNEGWPDQPDEARRRALIAMNLRRSARDAGPVKLDGDLNAAAQEHADKIAAGRASPHQGFPERVRSRGWTYGDCGIRNRGFGNISEGIAWGGQTPDEAILILDGAHNPKEGHRQDFEDPAFTHVGIAFARMQRRPEWVTVVDYGARCDAPPLRTASARPSAGDTPPQPLAQQARRPADVPPQPPAKPATADRKVYRVKDDSGTECWDYDPDALLGRVARRNAHFKAYGMPVAAIAAPAPSVRTMIRSFEPYGTPAPAWIAPTFYATPGLIPFSGRTGIRMLSSGCGPMGCSFR